VHRLPPPVDDAESRGAQAHGDVGRRAAGARDALVEPADAREGARPKRDVRAVAGCARDLLAVVRTAAGPHGNEHSALAAADVGREPLEIDCQLGEPAPARDHVVVEEDDPLGVRGLPTVVARRRRAFAAGADDVQALAQLGRDGARVERRIASRAIVDDDDAAGEAVGRSVERRQQQRERAATDGRHHDVGGGHATVSALLAAGRVRGVARSHGSASISRASVMTDGPC
jgi:hypothetical protein